MTKTYLEMLQFDTFDERFAYLYLGGSVGVSTFGFNRYINQSLYKSQEWKEFRNQIIFRDKGCDLGIEGYEIHDHILIHHINPITQEDILERRPCVFDPNNVISVSLRTHNNIHYSTTDYISREPIIRTPGDTCLWR